jgi:hypothetical protein
MSITLTRQVATTTARVEEITIRLCRDHAEVSAAVALIDSEGAVVRRETVEHPSPAAMVNEFIPHPDVFFDRVDALLVTRYPGTTTPNKDVSI